MIRMGYGAMGLSAFYGKPKPDAERMKVLDKLYQDGELFWDTAGNTSFVFGHMILAADTAQTCTWITKI
jgi:hypothetical protein